MSKSAAELKGEELGQKFMGLIAILGIISLIAPLYYFILLCITNYKVFKLKKIKNRKHFWLNQEEQSLYVDSSTALIESINNRDNIIKVAEHEGLSKNADGQYSLRSNRGKQIRNSLDTTNSAINELSPIENQLSWQPFQAWNKADKAFRGKKASLYGLLAYIISIAVFATMITLEPEYEAMIAFFGSAVVSIIVFLICRYTLASPSLLHFDKPPRVSPSNVKQWAISSQISQT